LEFFNDLHSQAGSDGQVDREHLISKLEDSIIDDKKDNIEKYLFENYKLYQVKPGTPESDYAKNDIFNRYYDLYEENDNHHLLGPVLKLEKKSVYRPKRLIVLLKAYAENRIYANFGLNIKEFMKLNAREIELLLESAQQINEEKQRVLSQVSENAGIVPEDLNEELEKELG